MSELIESQQKVVDNFEFSACLVGALMHYQSGFEGRRGPGDRDNVTVHNSAEALRHIAFLGHQAGGGIFHRRFSLNRVTKLAKDDQPSKKYFCGSRHLLPINIQYSTFSN